LEFLLLVDIGGSVSGDSDALKRVALRNFTERKVSPAIGTGCAMMYPGIEFSSGCWHNGLAGRIRDGAIETSITTSASSRHTLACRPDSRWRD
jgi:hypothetical protein